MNAVLILRDGITALERIRSIPEIALPPNMDPALLYLDPSLKRPEASVPHNTTVGDLQLEMVALHQRCRFLLLSPEEHSKVS